MLAFKVGMKRRFPWLTRGLGNMVERFNRVLGSREHPETILPFSRRPLHRGNEIDWSSVQQTIERILIKNILPFWYPGILDEEDGGYRLNHDFQWRWNGPADKFLVTQARTIWFFSYLVNTGRGGKHYLEAASHGFRFLRDRLWDSQFGGFYWSVDSTGQIPVKPHKELYAQAFGLFALSEYAKASGDDSAMQLAQELFAILERYFHDPRHGGYREFVQRDWKPADGNAVTYMKTPAPIKLMNSHLHLLEALTAYYGITKDPAVRDRLVELLLIQSGPVVNWAVGACTDQFHEDWKSFLAPERDRVSYAHDLENIWLLIEACDALGLPHSVFLELYRTVFNYALTFGFDRRKGGFYESGPLKRPADRLAKNWWVQAECLVSALYMHQLTGEKHYGDCFLRTLEWIIAYQIDWKHGDWHAHVGVAGKPSGEKAGRWKCPYHHGRAMMKCLQLLERPKTVIV